MVNTALIFQNLMPTSRNRYRTFMCKQYCDTLPFKEEM